MKDKLKEAIEKQFGTMDFVVLAKEVLNGEHGKTPEELGEVLSRWSKDDYTEGWRDHEDTHAV